MKKKLLLSMLLLLAGMSMQAQSVATEQMDERFNDGTQMPFGWFGEGWSVDDGKASILYGGRSSLDGEASRTID